MACTLQDTSLLEQHRGVGNTSTTPCSALLCEQMKKRLVRCVGFVTLVVINAWTSQHLATHMSKSAPQMHVLVCMSSNFGRYNSIKWTIIALVFVG